MTTAKAMTQAQIITKMSEVSGLSKAQTKQFFTDLSELAYKEAKKGFTIPGLGKLVVVKRKARMGRNPQTGESIKIAAKTVLKFRISKAAKDAVTPPKK